MGAEPVAETNKPAVVGTAKVVEDRANDASTETDNPATVTDVKRSTEHNGKETNKLAKVANGKTGDDSGAGAEANRPATVEDRKISDGTGFKTAASEEKSMSPGTEREYLNGMLNDDDIAKTLAAASEKLQAAHRRDQLSKRNSEPFKKFVKTLHPKKLFFRLRDCYINTCLMAAEKGDFTDLVAGHPGITFGDSVAMSRNMSTRRDREKEEMIQASISRQVSGSLSRQQSQSVPGILQMTRNTSTGMPGMPRHAPAGGSGLYRNASAGPAWLSRSSSSGISGLPRNASTGMPGFGRSSSLSKSGSTKQTSIFGRSSSSRKHRESNLFSAGRDTFLQKYQQQKIASAFPVSVELNQSPNTRNPVISESSLEVRVTPDATDYRESQKPVQ